MDGAVNGVGAPDGVRRARAALIQTGRVQDYLLFVVTIVLMLLGLYLYL